MLRFTICDVLWLMVVVGLASGWFADHRRLTLPRWDVESDFDGLSPSDIWIDPLARQRDQLSNT